MIRLIQEDGLKARAQARQGDDDDRDDDQPVAANVLDRQCVAKGPKRRWRPK
ncbi:MAG: hypothetical protein ABJA98_34680 [Acidobacteriota bacterium]